jgi:predicted ATPase
LDIRTADPLPALVAAVRDNRMLLLLDNCEHVIDAVAGLAEAVLNGTSGVDILATSREPLAVPGERVYRLGPLASPEPSSALTAAGAGAFPAVQLFFERVTAVVEDFALTDANARWSSRFAVGSTACRWRSSSQHRASRHSGWRP